MRGDQLTERQRQVLECVRAHMREWGLPPSRSEIAKALGLAHASAVAYHLSALERKGWIRLDRGRDRGIRLLREGAPVFDPEHLPAVSAGQPLLADEGAVARVPDTIAELVHPRADCYLVVRGDSMDLAGYRPGDIVALARNAEPRDGDVVVARMGSDITLKRFHRRDPAAIELQPRSTNPEHEAIRIDATTNDWEILGVVVGAMVGPPAAPATSH